MTLERRLRRVKTTSPVAPSGLQYVGGASFGEVALSSDDFTVSLSGTLSGGLSSSPEEGDYVIIAFTIGDTTNRNMTRVDLTWDELIDSYANDTYDVNLGAYGKIMGAVPDTSFTGTVVSASNSHVACVAHVWRGINTTNQLDTSVVSRPQSNTNIIDSTAITTVTDGAVVLSIGGGVNFGDPYTAPSGMENFVSSGGSGSLTRVVISSALVETAGVYNPGPYGGGVINSLICYTAQTLALRPE